MLKCYNKPIRTKKRIFRTCDAARIAREVVKDDPEATPEEVLGCIAKGFGFTHISLSRMTSLQSNIGITKVPIKPTLLILEKLLVKISKQSATLKALLIPVLATLKKLIGMADKIDLIEPPQAEVDDVINKDKCNCKTKTKIK